MVAAENFWGSIAAQLGGSKAAVQSVVTDPNADPHEYASSADDARAFADAGLVILNGAGYDDWGKKLIGANPSSDRQVLDIAGLLGMKVGDNPHFWYSPEYVTRVADGILAAYKAIDSADSAYFDQNRAAFSASLQAYTDEVAAIRQRFSGTPIGSTESVFVYKADALGLDLTTPASFMNAVAQGSDPPAMAVIAFQNQISSNQIKALVYVTQTTTAVTTNIKAAAAAHHIPAVGMSETLQPPNATFQDWQVRQLESLEAALSANP
ncbi:MAG TPA: zinc ABC transporter substrate-binding protein [Patescibacteria group bacterium]|nr:zinc ABC transporter substrate-binding protein [Patescibacteria group bacterium]